MVKSKAKSKSKAKRASANNKTTKSKKSTIKSKPKPKKAAPRKKAATSKKATKPAPKKKALVKKPTVKKPTVKKPAVKKPAVKKTGKKKPVPKKVGVKAANVRPVVKVAPSRVSARPKGKVLPKQFLVALASAIKESVVAPARAMKGREIVSTSISGDATFELDRIAERALLNHLKSVRAPVAYYSEDAGYSTFSNVQPKYLIVVDPIDGTRAAKSGFEGCVVSVASTRIIERPTMADVDNAVVMELFADRYFYAERGKGARMSIDGHARKPKLSDNENLERLTWSMTVPARPAELIFPTAARLIDLSSLKGGFFACNSTSYSLTRLLTNQLDACVDFAGRYIRDIPDLVRDYFINAGRGVVLGIAPYDMAGSLLIAQEAGCVVTDAFGEGFDDVLLLDSSEANHMSLVAASNPALHKKLMSFFDTRIKQFETLLKKRAAAR